MYPLIIDQRDVIAKAKGGQRGSDPCLTHSYIKRVKQRLFKIVPALCDIACICTQLPILDRHNTWCYSYDMHYLMPGNLPGGQKRKAYKCRLWQNP